MRKKKESPDLWHLERELQNNYAIICGADEAGAGPLAGDVYAAAVILPFHTQLKGLNDSKKISAMRRNELFDQIQEVAIGWAIERVDVTTIDEINILEARLLAMKRAVEALNPVPDFALIDGNRVKGITCPYLSVTGGDGRSANIAAASILAKVARDRYMEEMDELYPAYEFARHKGYGTALHFQHLRKYGPCPIHRKSFLKKL